ncbi:uncharacterized protein LOC123439754 [Hordeum vulgare subsp. vulgare]|uniref:Uncharacterized protein n=1 Tax=Hordeum vulgare subsp. vulgare TaxID=112509 RepID=A0A8I6XT19_HORVV|nr:uncharacterized protein LOC123439754 [Hordeum vulgare subsp. vulgare]
MAEALLLACHLLLALSLVAPSISHLFFSALAHISHAHTNNQHFRFLRHSLFHLLPVIAALPFPFLPIAPTSRLLPFILLPPLLLPLALPFLPSNHLQFLRPIFLSLPLLLLARAAGILADAFPTSDLQAHFLYVTALLLITATTASLLSALSQPRSIHHLLAETMFTFVGIVGGLWALQGSLNLYVDSYVPAGCHRLMDATLAPATRCDVDEVRLQAIAVMDVMLSVHCLIAATFVAGLHLGVAKWYGVDGGGVNVGMGTSRRHNGVGGSYDALPMVPLSSGAIEEMEHLVVKGVVGKAVAQE